MKDITVSVNNICSICSNKLGETFTLNDYNNIAEELRIIASEYYCLIDKLDDIEAIHIIEERQKNDDGTRYTTEDIKRLRIQRSE